MGAHHNRTRISGLLRAALCAAATIAITSTTLIATTFAPAVAQEFPTRPLRLVVGFTPGGGADLMARTVGGLLSEQIGKQVVVDNRGGAGGTLAAEAVANATPDGHTLLLVTIANALHPHVYKLSYDPVRAHAPIALFGRGGYILGVTPSLPATTIAELLNLAKAKPGQLLMGNSGAGSFVHLASVLFSLSGGVDITHVAYKGSGPALTDVLGGHSQIAIIAPGQAAPHVKAGRFRALGATDSRRSKLLPDVPTVAEAGLPGYEAANWWGLVATGGTPRAVIDKLHAEIVKVLASDKAREQFEREGAEVSPMGPDQLAKFMAVETEKWGRVVREAKIKAE